MKFTSKLICSIGMGVLCLVSTAETSIPNKKSAPNSQIKLSDKVLQFQPKITGMFYTATQYTSTSGDLDAWNLARLGYQFTDNFNLSYNQVFLNDYRTKTAAGFNLRIDDAYLRLKWNEVYQINGPNLKIGLEQRYYVPTSSSSLQKSMVTGLRNRILTKVKITDSFSLGLEESPVLYWYRDAVSANGPNELFRNYVVLTPTLTGMKEKLNFYFPIYLQNSVYRQSFGGVSNRGAWKHKVFVWPEITYAINDNVELGLATITGNLVSDDFAKLTLSDALKDVTTAFEITLSL